MALTKPGNVHAQKKTTTNKKQIGVPCQFHRALQTNFFVLAQYLRLVFINPTLKNMSQLPSVDSEPVNTESVVCTNDTNSNCVVLCLNHLKKKQYQKFL